MGRVYFTSDIHFGHENIIAAAGRPFATAHDMYETVIENWNKKVKKGDRVYIVGDLVFGTREPEKYIPRLNGRKVLILGNHDSWWHEGCELSRYFDYVAKFAEEVINCRMVTLCHYPMLEWRASRKKGCTKLGYHVHGHIHGRTDAVYRPLFIMPHALNASVDVNGFEPVTFDELIENNEAFKLAALTDPVDKALFLAEKYHLYQCDRSGKPYVEHPKAVAAMCDGTAAKCVALMHDLLEDTDIDIELLRRHFPREVVEAVQTVSKREGEDYFDFIARIAENKLATKVKLADLTHNMDMSRLRVVTEADVARCEKYKKAYAILQNTL